MSVSPELTTNRLKIVPFGEEFLTAEYAAWLNDPEVVRYSTQRHKIHTIESCRSYWHSFAGTSHLFWAVVEHDQGLGHIGNMNAYIDLNDGVADLGILLGNKNAWRQGYATEAWAAVCKHLFSIPGIRKITAGACTTNTPMLAVMRAAGMIEDGRRLRHTLVDGEETDIVHAALFRDSRQADRRQPPLK